ncbi:MAG: endopeptidase La [Proteobacteria bacterium]|nr:endopeptidase La [Pseudomonadota bacterium]
MTEPFDSTDFLPESIPEDLSILPVFDVALFPKMVLPLVVRNKSALRLIDDAMAGSRIIGLLLSKKPSADVEYSTEDLHTTGTLAMILKMAKGEDDRIQLMVQGLGRFKLREFIGDTPYLKAHVDPLPDIQSEDKETQALVSNMVSHYQKIVKLSPGLPPEIGEMASAIPDPGTLADMITSTINSSLEDKQKVLELQQVKKRLKKVTEIVNYQLEILEIGSKIQTQVKEDMNNKQKEYFLRQQMKAIQEELGETGENNSEIQDYRTKLFENNLPEEARREAERELKRLARMHPSSSEYTVSSTYLDWLTALPWDVRTEDNLDIAKAKKILDDDHFGLKKAKKRIIEYLAVRQLKPDSKGPILCLAGPPGTGKTSLGQSIAKALGRKFVRIALGGMRDEAEIRGHRRTYVGALPGRIIQGIRRAGTNNPIIVFDEIDKVGNSFQGDPSSALLEVLDPEQNFSFSDHYLDVPFDLSNVMFITTANVLHTIPPALLDRLEVLELSGYTEEEKIKIAYRYLIPKQRRANGLKANQFTITKGAVRLIISGYTREAGLRNLERELANICRGTASLIVQEEATSVEVKVTNVAKFLGQVRYISETSERTTTPGVVMGLAWTPAGGEILFIEATAMKGNKGLTLTGQLGNVMKESASTALSFIRTNASKMGINDEVFNSIDLHIHVPSGAIPKDGPSAGVTMLTALTSILTGMTVRKNLAMSGEITLRGQVLPVGGVKEKVIAAHRAGIRTIILPQWNKNDLEDIPIKVIKSIQFHFVDTMREVMELAFERRTRKVERRSQAKEVNMEKRVTANDRRQRI